MKSSSIHTAAESQQAYNESEDINLEISTWQAKYVLYKHSTLTINVVVTAVVAVIDLV